MATLQKLREETINEIYYLSAKKTVHNNAVIQILKLNPLSGQWKEIYYKKVNFDSYDSAFDEQKELILKGEYNYA